MKTLFFHQMVGCLCFWLGINGAARGEEQNALELAQQAFQPQVFKTETGEQLPFLLLSPEKIQEQARYPLVLFLHGAGERGDDNQAQLIHVVKELARPELRSRYPAFVVAPQCPKEQKWVDVPWDSQAHQMPEQPSRPMQLTMEMLNSLKKTLPIDSDQIYLVGLSMGGYGVWDLMQRQPKLSAGSVVICGGGDPAFAKDLTSIPIWAFHGDADRAVNVARSRFMIAAIREAGGHPIYTEYPGVGHDSWTRTAENRLVWDWLFAQGR